MVIRVFFTITANEEGNVHGKPQIIPGVYELKSIDGKWFFDGTDYYFTDTDIKIYNENTEILEIFEEDQNIF